MTASPPTLLADVIDIDEAARITKRTTNALRILRHRDRGPRSWKYGKKIHYYRADVEAWFAEQQAADKHFNPVEVPVQRRIKPAA